MIIDGHNIAGNGTTALSIIGTTLGGAARPELSEFFDAAGNIQLDVVVNRAAEAMQKTLRIDAPVIAVTLEESDIDVIKNYSQNA